MSQPPEPDGESKGEASAIDGLAQSVPWMARICGLVQGFSGMLGGWFLWQFLNNPGDSDLRYQHLLVPILVWMVSVTILFASVLVISRSPQRLNKLDWTWFGLGSAIPTVIMTAVLFTPFIG